MITWRLLLSAYYVTIAERILVRRVLRSDILTRSPHVINCRRVSGLMVWVNLVMYWLKILQRQQSATMFYHLQWFRKCWMDCNNLEGPISKQNSAVKVFFSYSTRRSQNIPIRICTFIQRKSYKSPSAYHAMSPAPYSPLYVLSTRRRWSRTSHRKHRVS
jgi:hypothetical protein